MKVAKPARAARKTSIQPEPRRAGDKADGSDQSLSRALEKGLQAIEILAEESEGLSLSAASERLGLSKPSAFRILHTLESLGYLAKAQDGAYSAIGGRVRHLSSRFLERFVHIGTGILQQLVLEFRETATLSALFHNHIEVVAVVESPELIRMTNTLGRILPPHGSSMGKSIAAFLDHASREHLLRSYGTAAITANTTTDTLALSREFEQIRSRGYAEDWEESTPGGVCFGAPILRPSGAPVGAISVSLPKMRLDGDEKQRRIIQAVKQAAAEVSRRAFD